MSEPFKPKDLDEQALIKFYIELTGATEAEARAVLMHTCFQDRSGASPPPSNGELNPDDLPPPPSLQA